MEFLYRFFPETLIEAIGWTLFHSLWQGAILTILLIGVLYILKKSRAQIRYLVSFLMLVILFIWAGITFNSAYRYANEKQVLKKDLITHPELVIGAMQGKLQHTYTSKTYQTSDTQLKWIQFRAFMQRNFPVVFMLWLIGVLIFLTRMAGGMLYMQSLRRRKILPPDDFWIQKIEEMKNRLGIKRSITAVQSALIKVPMVLGYLKPVVLFPVTFFTGLSAEELEAVIAHELAHISRHDYLLNIIQSVIETLFFFHPAVWLMSKNIRDERELCCDDLAIKITGDRMAYMKALALSQEFTMSRQNQYALTFSSGKGSLLKRIQRIKNHNIMKNKVPEGFIAASLIFISVVLLSFSIDNGKLNNEYFHSSRFNKADRLISSGTQKNVAAVADNRYECTLNYDSIDIEMQEVVEELETLPEEMEQLMEINYTENDHEFALLILESVNLAMSQIDMEVMRREIDRAMLEVDSVMAERDREAMYRDEACLEMENVQMQVEIANEAIRIAAETIEAINVDEIVRVAMEKTRLALESIDFEAIERVALEESRVALEETRVAMEEMEQTTEWHQATMEDDPDIRNERYRSMEEQLDELEK